MHTAICFAELLYLEQIIQYIIFNFSNCSANISNIIMLSAKNGTHLYSYYTSTTKSILDLISTVLKQKSKC